LVGALLVTVFFACNPAWAAEGCAALSDGIHKERVLMKKKALVADALKSCPNDPEIVYQDGYILERFRKYEEALARYKKAVSLDPGYAKAYFSMGDIQAVLNNYGEAIAAYQEGLKYDSSNARARSSLKEALAKYQGTPSRQTPAVQPQSTVPVVGVVAAGKDVKGDVKKVAAKAAATGPAVRSIERLVIPFEGDSTELSRQARDVLGVVVGQAMNREDMRNSRFEVGGHTDNLGDAKKNDEIARQRALAVRNYLSDGFGIDAERLKAVSHGQQNPKVPNDTAANRGINRRVEFSRLD